MLLQTVRTKRLMMLVLVLASSLLVADRAEAQVVPPYGQFQPLNQYLTPGTAGHWAAIAGKGSGNWSQPVKIHLDGGGDVTVPPFVSAYPHVHLRMDWSDEGRRRTGAGSCRVGACQAKRAELAADLQMTQNALRAYTDTVGAQVVGQVRAAEQQVAAMQREVDACKCEAAKSARTWSKAVSENRKLRDGRTN